MTSPLTREQERIALTLIKQGEGDSKNLFVHCNQPLVGRVASPYRGKGLTWDDLIAAGNVGLVQAINRFEVESGNKFSTFAVPWIKGEITSAFKKLKSLNDSDRRILTTENGVPLRFDEETAQKIIEDDALLVVIAADVEAQNEHESEMLSDHTDGAAWDTVDDESPMKDPTSEGSAGGGYAINLAPDQSTGALSVDSDLLPAFEEVIERLEDPRQALVIRMYLGLGGHERHTFKQIGDVLDVSAQRVHAILQTTFTHLRNDTTLQMLFEQTI